jgi:hypothetical protein
MIIKSFKIINGRSIPDISKNNNNNINNPKKNQNQKIIIKKNFL